MGFIVNPQAADELADLEAAYVGCEKRSAVVTVIVDAIADGCCCCCYCWKT